MIPKVTGGVRLGEILGAYGITVEQEPQFIARLLPLKCSQLIVMYLNRSRTPTLAHI